MFEGAILLQTLEKYYFFSKMLELSDIRISVMQNLTASQRLLPFFGVLKMRLTRTWKHIEGASEKNTSA